MAVPVDRVFELADEVRGVVVDGYAADGVGLPPWTMVAAEMPAYERDMLAVVAERTYGQDGNVAAEQSQPMAAHPAFWLRGAQLAVLLLRCVPTVRQDGIGSLAYPPPSEREDAARVIYADGVRMLNHLAAASKEGRLGARNQLAFQEWALVEPSGGLGGGILRVRIGVL